jgi:hypothetical protein
MNLNRLIISIFLIIFSLQSLTKADDISDFQIEGMSIGDSLLDYMSEEEIKNSPVYDFKSKKMYQLRKLNNNDMYTEIMFGLITNDKTYKIYSIEGIIKYENNIKDCYPKKNEIANEIEELFPEAQKKNWDSYKLVSDKSGKSKGAAVYFYLKSGGESFVACYDWTKKMKYWDNLRVGINSKKFSNWMKNEAY